MLLISDDLIVSDGALVSEVPLSIEADFIALSALATSLEDLMLII